MSLIHISNGRLESIVRERDTTFVTITYIESTGNRRREQTVRLLVRPRTVILNANGDPANVSALRVGMLVNASFSSEMTRSIPPQANAYLIRIVREAPRENITVGRIVETNQRNRSFMTISDRDFSTIIRFNVAENARIIDRFGRNVNFSRLTPGMRVRVRHADFMTASIPPQTTAFEVQIL